MSEIPVVHLAAEKGQTIGSRPLSQGMCAVRGEQLGEATCGQCLARFPSRNQPRHFSPYGG